MLANEFQFYHRAKKSYKDRKKSHKSQTKSYFSYIKLNKQVWTSKPSLQKVNTLFIISYQKGKGIYYTSDSRPFCTQSYENQYEGINDFFLIHRKIWVLYYHRRIFSIQFLGNLIFRLNLVPLVTFVINSFYNFVYSDVLLYIFFLVYSYGLLFWVKINLFKRY